MAASCDLQVFGKTVHYAADASRVFLGHDAQCIVRRRPGMNDKRLPALNCRTNMGTESVALPVQVSGQPVVIQPGFTDGDNFGMLSQTYQFGLGWLSFQFVIRMHADRGEKIVMLFSQFQHIWEGLKLNRNAQGMRNIVRAHLVQDGINIFDQVGKIKVAMGINEHGYSGSKQLTVRQ